MFELVIASKLGKQRLRDARAHLQDLSQDEAILQSMESADRNIVSIGRMEKSDDLVEALRQVVSQVYEAAGSLSMVGAARHRERIIGLVERLVKVLPAVCIQSTLHVFRAISFKHGSDDEEAEAPEDSANGPTTDIDRAMVPDMHTFDKAVKLLQDITDWRSLWLNEYLPEVAQKVGASLDGEFSSIVRDSRKCDPECFRRTVLCVQQVLAGHKFAGGFVGLSTAAVVTYASEVGQCCRQFQRQLDDYFKDIEEELEHAEDLQKVSLCKKWLMHKLGTTMTELLSFLRQIHNPESLPRLPLQPDDFASCLTESSRLTPAMIQKGLGMDVGAVTKMYDDATGVVQALKVLQGSDSDSAAEDHVTSYKACRVKPYNTIKL